MRLSIAVERVVARTHINTASTGFVQVSRELRAKLKVTQREITLHRKEENEKDKFLAEAALRQAQTVSERDRLQAELNSAILKLREMQETVNEQISETDRLTNVIANCEKSMLRQRQLYENAVEKRNLNGLTLIDRNDELCILYEKSNLQVI